jgi:hypothetical protein
VRIARLGERRLSDRTSRSCRARFPSPEFHVPFTGVRPITVAAGQSPDQRSRTKARWSGGNEQNQIVPYHDRAAIDGALDGKARNLLAQGIHSTRSIRSGSARVILEDGAARQHDAHNGLLIRRLDACSSSAISSRRGNIVQRIRDWMAAHQEWVRGTNRSYVFFRSPANNEGEPVGAPKRFIDAGPLVAVDRLHEYSTPFFIERADEAQSRSPFRRLMVAQDTGSAIIGPARADLYWGAGDEPAIAGRIRHRSVRDARSAHARSGRRRKEMPLPIRKPQIPEAEVKRTSGGRLKPDVAKRRTKRSPASLGKPAARAGGSGRGTAVGAYSTGDADEGRAVGFTQSDAAAGKAIPSAAAAGPAENTHQRRLPFHPLRPPKAPQRRPMGRRQKRRLARGGSIHASSISTPRPKPGPMPSCCDSCARRRAGARFIPRHHWQGSRDDLASAACWRQVPLWPSNRVPLHAAGFEHFRHGERCACPAAPATQQASRTRRCDMKRLIAVIAIAATFTPAVPAPMDTPRPITIVVPFPAGGPTDALARVLRRMRGALGQP